MPNRVSARCISRRRLAANTVAVGAVESATGEAAGIGDTIDPETGAWGAYATGAAGHVPAAAAPTPAPTAISAVPTGNSASSPGGSSTESAGGNSTDEPAENASPAGCSTRKSGEAAVFAGCPLRRALPEAGVGAADAADTAAWAGLFVARAAEVVSAGPLTPGGSKSASLGPERRFAFPAGDALPPATAPEGRCLPAWPLRRKALSY